MQQKAMLKRKFIALNTHILTERPKIHQLSFTHRKLEKEKQVKSKVSRRNKNYNRNQ
jgi:hypothetical protein